MTIIQVTHNESIVYDDGKCHPEPTNAIIERQTNIPDEFYKIEAVLAEVIQEENFLKPVHLMVRNDARMDKYLGREDNENAKTSGIYILAFPMQQVMFVDYSSGWNKEGLRAALKRLS